MQNKNTIFFDLDGVLADFNHSAERNLGIKLGWNGILTSVQWDHLSDYPHFYARLPKTKYCDDFIDLALKYSDRYTLGFLSSTPSVKQMPYAAQDKIAWIHDNIIEPRGIQIYNIRIVDHWSEKKIHLTQGDIFIDDKQKVCDDCRNSTDRVSHFQNHESFEKCYAELENWLKN